MKTRPVFRAALLCSLLLAAACGKATTVDETPDAGPDAGPGQTVPDAGPKPTAEDTDADGLPNTLEDKNGNGRVDDGETDPNNRDSDCDGLLDGPDSGGLKGEDQNANGQVDPGETSPLLRDSDQDGLTDGVERGVTQNLEPARCTAFVPDADPTTTTDATDPDSDNDGVADGAEDVNQDGKKDPGELDPGSSADVPTTGPAAKVCTADNLKPVAFRTEGLADLKVALPAAPRFAELTDVTVGGVKVGFMGYDVASQVAFLAYKQAAPKTNPTEDEAVLRAKLAVPGALSNPLTQTFTTWDGYAALKSQYDQAGTADLKARANALADALLGAGAGSLSSAASGFTGPFRVQAEFIHRSDKSLVVLVALTPLTNVSGTVGTPLFTLNDLSAGSSVAQFADGTAVQCETFTAGNAMVDFVFVVDDSGSMATSQGSLGASADAIAKALRGTSLDWRIALVTSTYHINGSTKANFNKLRPFTRNINQLKAWMKQNSTCSSNVCSGVSVTADDPEAPYCPGDASWGANGGCWVSVSGEGAEGLLGAARKAITTLSPAGDTDVATKVRTGAKVVVILLGDADDQTTGTATTKANCGSGGTTDKAGSECESVENFKTFFTQNQVPVHGIVCPSGAYCGCTGGACGASGVDLSTREFNPQPTAMEAVAPQRHAAVVRATGGILGSILDNASIDTSIRAIVQDAIGASGYELKKAPIGASIKVALESVLNGAACNKDDLPRSRTDGFDFDGKSIAFYGACRAASVSTAGAVSYRYWVDAATAADGQPPCKDDPRYDPNEADHCQGYYACSTQNACVCQEPTSGCPTGQRFNPTACACEVVFQ